MLVCIFQHHGSHMGMNPYGSRYAYLSVSTVKCQIGSNRRGLVSGIRSHDVNIWMSGSYHREPFWELSSSNVSNAMPRHQPYRIDETVQVLFNNLGNDPMTGQSVNIPQFLPACTGFVELTFRSPIVMCLFDVCKTYTVYIYIHIYAHPNSGRSK